MRRLICTLITGITLAWTGAAAIAQQYPNKPIRVLVPYAPGGTTDVVARLVAEYSRKTLGQQMVIENKPGASGIVAIEELARSRPDGYTVMVGNISTSALTPILLKKRMSIDYDKSVQVVARLANLPLMFVVATKDFAPKTLAEFVAHAKANPGKVRYASAGFGAFQQIDMEHFAKVAGLSLVHIPNKAGGTGMMRDIGTGDVHATWFSTLNGGIMIKQGRARGLAVAMERRHPDYPDTPTMAEAGYPGVGGGQWQAAFVPAGTPKEIVELLNRTFMQALTEPMLLEAYKKGDITAPAPHTAAEAQAWIAGETEKWRKLIAELNIVVDE